MSLLSVPPTFGPWLRGQREARGLTIDQARRAAGLAWSAWSELEKGGRTRAGKRVGSNPTNLTLVKIARVLGVPAAEVYIAAGRVPPGVERPELAAPDAPTASQVLAALQRVASTEEGRRQIRAILGLDEP